MKISDVLLEYCLEDGFRGNNIHSKVSDMILTMAKEIKEYRDANKTKCDGYVYDNPAPDSYFESIRASRDNMSPVGDNEYDV